MRRYELMLVLRPDVADDKAQAVIDRATRQVSAGGGQIVKVAPWGRRRLAYPIDRYREGSYHIILFESPAEVIAEVERGLLITEEVLRHLVTRVERPLRAARPEGVEEEGSEESELPLGEDEEDFDDTERIDESETEAAPAAID
jgi:small subunit ribosomal protein S6